tara:strand:+ start:842 stop:1474 length:633 start_codon:yes stop_codon:yes gene_type:complete
MRIISFLLICYTITLYLAIIASESVDSFSNKYLYSNLVEIPTNKVGVLLGTSKYLSSGEENLYFTYRMEAAEKLYYSNKISYILVSGDNATIHYNEPIAIKKELIKRGIPEEKIVLDYAGFRTFDSMIRANKVFGQNEFTVISQPFHNERAIFIARKKGINAIGYNAKDVTFQSGFKTQLREKFARIKLLLDIYILNTQPKFLGEKINIP